MVRRIPAPFNLGASSFLGHHVDWSLCVSSDRPGHAFASLGVEKEGEDPVFPKTDGISNYC